MTFLESYFSVCKTGRKDLSLLGSLGGWTELSLTEVFGLCLTMVALITAPHHVFPAAFALGDRVGACRWQGLRCPPDQLSSGKMLGPSHVPLW